MKTLRAWHATLFTSFICAVVLAFASAAFAADAAKIDALFSEAIGRNLISGGVVLIGSRDKVLFEKAYGRVSALPDARPMSTDTVFDIASLTKVVATPPPSSSSRKRGESPCSIRSSSGSRSSPAAARTRCWS